MTALLAPDEAARLATLRSLKILDTPSEAAYDDLVLAAAALLDVPVAYLSLVDTDRLWFKAKVGLELCELSREDAFCAHTVLGTEPVVVPDATVDPRFASNPFVTGPFGVRFYAGVPVVVEGRSVGTLCCADIVPKSPSARQIEGLHALARGAAALLAARRQAEAHAEGERRFLAFLDHAPVIAFLKDEEGRVRFANRLHAETHGYAPGEYDDADHHRRLPAEFREVLRRHDEAVRAGGEPLEIDSVVPRSDGTPRVWNIIKFPIRTEDETWIGGVALDVTDVRAAEGTIRAQREELARRNAELEERDRALSQALSVVEREKARLAQAEARFAAFFDHAPVGAFMKDAAGRYLFSNHMFQRVVGKDAATILDAVDHDLFPAAAADGFREADAEVRRTLRPLEIEEDVPVEGGPTERWRTVKFPVTIEGEVWVAGVGVDLTALRAAETRVGVQNAELVRRERELTVALQEAETAKASALIAASRFAQLFDGLPVACYTYGEGGTIHEWNAAAESLWDIRAEDALLASVGDTVVGPANRARQREIDARVFAGEAVLGEERLAALRDGTERWLLTSTFPLRSPGGAIVGAVSANVDVTERKRAEAEIRASESRFRTVVEALQEGLTVQDAEGRILLWNPSAQRIIGADITGSNASDGRGTAWRAVREDGTEYELDEMPIPRALRTGETQAGAIVGIETAEGVRWLSVNASPLVSEGGGSPREAVSSFVDITGRKRMEEAIRESEARLQAIVDSLHEGLMVQNAAGETVIFNPSATRMLDRDVAGANADDRRSKGWRLLWEDGSEMAPGDFPVTRSLRTGESYEGVVMGIEPLQGATRWLSVNAVPLVREGTDSVVEAVASFVDITERRRMETALRESEARFRTVVESLAEGLVVHDEERRVAYWNRSAERILGMTADQMRGLNAMPKEYRFVNEDGTDARYESRPATVALRTGERQEPRTMGVHMPGGEFRWLSVGAVPVLSDDGGRPTSAVSSFLDVTERVEQDRRLRTYSAELEEANARLEALATTDGLTGLKNHRFFQDWLRRRIEQCAGSRMPLSVALLDVDRFKAYNDDFGHQAGDAVLRGVAKALERTVRAGDLVARYGGEEFVIVLPGADAEEATSVAERVREAVADLPFPDRAVTASFGVATFGADLPDAPAMIRAADEALYRSKDGGRNRVTHCRSRVPELNAA